MGKLDYLPDYKVIDSKLHILTGVFERESGAKFHLERNHDKTGVILYGIDTSKNIGYGTYSINP